MTRAEAEGKSITDLFGEQWADFQIAEPKSGRADRAHMTRVRFITSLFAPFDENLTAMKKVLEDTEFYFGGGTDRVELMTDGDGYVIGAFFDYRTTSDQYQPVELHLRDVGSRMMMGGPLDAFDFFVFVEKLPDPDLIVVAGVGPVRSVNLVDDAVPF